MRYATGALQLEEADLDSAGFGLDWGHTRSYNYTASKYRGGGRSQSLNGTNWSVQQIPSIQVQASGNVAVAFGQRMFWFAPGPDKTLRAMFPFTSRLSRDSSQGYMLVPDDSGTIYQFDAKGHFRSVLNPLGEQMAAGYDGAGRLTSLQLASSATPGTSAVYTYTYTGSGHSGDRLAGVLYQVNGADVRRVSYTYYAGGDPRGNAGDLATATVEGYNSGSSTWYGLRNFHYRYWKPARANGFVTGLKFAVGSQAYANMVAAGLDPLTVADAQLAEYADLYLEYTGMRISREVTDGGAYAYSFRYQPSWGNGGRNSWMMKTVETLPGVGTDGTHDRNVVYTNAGGQVLLKVFVSGGEKWCTYYRYDAQGTCVLEAQPSAVAGYDERAPGLVTLKPSDGLVQLFEYKDKEGYGTKISVAKGSQGIPVRIRSMTYVSRTTSAGTVRLLASESVYQREAGGGTAAAKTIYTYSWQGDSLQLAERTTTLPVVPTSQNGSDVAAQRQEVYDAQGNVTWSKDERGFITHQQYDPATGALVEQIEDVQTSGLSGVPLGWATPTGGGLNLTTDYTVDLLGRVTQELGPIYLANPSLPSTGVRRATWTVYRDDLRQVWQARGSQAHGRGFAATLVNPVSLTQLDYAGRTVDQIQAVRTNTSGPLLPTDTFPQTTWCRWTHNTYDAQNHLASRRTYFLIPATGAGGLGANYNEANYGFDASGWQNRQVTPGGTITRTVFHPQGWVLQTWIGTNDAGATDSDPSGGGAPGNNMVIVAANQYDGAAAGGDGTLTQSTLYQDAGTTRVTSYGYDFRDRRTSMNPPTGARESYTFDNQDRVTRTDRQDPTSGVLVGRSATKYDRWGRAYQTISYAVDSGTGMVGNALTGNTWFDPAGQVVKSQEAGSSLFTKTLYDGVGRATIIYRGYNLAATAYPYPVDVSTDTVIGQVENSYDEAGNLLAQIKRERNHDATGTGSLDTAMGVQPQARASYQASYSDALGRINANANFGTNGGASWLRPGSIPAPSDTVLVTLMAYDSAGNLYQQTDPQAIVTQSAFDQAGRLTQTLANYQPGGTAPDQNQEVDYTYNADSRPATLIAKNSATGDQVTQFVYGTTFATSDVASNDLLAQKIFPGDTASVPDRLTYAYDRLGEVKQSTDGNGTVHQYVYDALGRPLHDCVTTLGAGVNNSVLRISRAYEVRGMLTQVTSFNNAAVGSGTVVNDVLLTYNGFGQLSADYQAHAGAVNTASTPSVQYTYADGSANTTRRTGITYPDGRTILYDYGASAGIDDALSRLGAIIDGDGTTLASFAYLGLDTRVRMDVG